MTENLTDEVKSYRDLRVWQSSIELVEMIYNGARHFPKHEIYGLASQMQRSAVSVPSNIAEGHAREHLKEYINYISMAQGSLAELSNLRLVNCTVVCGFIDMKNHSDMQATNRELLRYTNRDSIKIRISNN